MPLSPNFQSALRKALSESDAAKSEIAQKIGVTRATLYNWRDGVTRPDVYHVVTLAGVLNVPIEELWISEGPTSASERHRLATLERMRRRLRELLDEVEQELDATDDIPSALDVVEPEEFEPEEPAQRRRRRTPGKGA